jgi:peptidoglycan hydrolase-like protein with peptidoglycan-binding domain
MANINRKPRLASIVTMMISFLLIFGSMTGTASASAQAGLDGKTAEKSSHASSTTASVQDICNYTTARPTIRRGSTGAAVKQAQCYVYYSVQAADLAIDGDFGPITDHWVRVFQGCAGITVDGVVGPVTWGQLTYWANSPNYVC